MPYVTIRPPVRAPRACDMFDLPEGPLAREVIVSDDAPIETGLLDHNGTPIYRTSDRIKMGFLA